MKNNKFVVLFSLLFLAVLASVIYYSLNKKADKPKAPEADTRTVKAISITANNDRFEPTDINSLLFADLDLNIKAEDKDYYFKVEGYPRFDTVVKKGETKTVKLYALGVGEYNYYCSETCGGKVIISQKMDQLKVEEDGSIIEVEDED